MTKLEENNINTQISLMTDIISNYNSIIYSIMGCAAGLDSLLKTRTRNEVENTVSLKQNTFQNLIEMVSCLSSEIGLSKLNGLTEIAVTDNEIKKKVLQMLKA